MKSRYFTIVWWLLLISIPVVAYIDDFDVLSNKSLASPIMVLIVLFCICHGLRIYYQGKEKRNKQ